jgi:hypothetical protein
MIGRLLPIPVGLWLGILCSLVLALGSTSWRVFLIALVAALALVFLRAPIQVRQSLLIAIPFLTIGLFLGWLKAAAVTDSTIQKLINDSTPGIAVFEIRSDPVQIQGKYETSQAVQVTLREFQNFESKFTMRTPGRLIIKGPLATPPVIGEVRQAQLTLRAGESMRGRAFVAYPKGELAVLTKAPWWQEVASNLRTGLAGATSKLPTDSAR